MKKRDVILQVKRDKAVIESGKENTIPTFIAKVKRTSNNYQFVTPAQAGVQ